MQFKDYYEVLGVARDAPAAEVKKAYRKAARRYHPDVSKEADAATRMSEVNEAYAVLSDPERRAAYDALGRGRRPGEAFTPPPDWDAGFEFRGGAPEGFDAGEFSDFFAQLFGSRGRAGARPRGDRSGLRGEDHHAKIVLDLEDAWRGATRQVTLRSPQLDAQGRVGLHERTLDVRIPAGVRPGQLIRLAGQGGAGQSGAPAGDLFLEVHFGAHARFRLDGALLGAVVPVALPDGSTLKVRVPAGAQSGRRLEVRGKGLPGATPGDLELVVQVLLPSAMEPRARRLYEQMAAELPDFDARRVAAAQTERGE